MRFGVESRMALDTLLDLVFPSRCAACHIRVAPADDWCAACAATFVSGFEHACLGCGRIHLEGGVAHLCSHCIHAPPATTWTRAAFAYGGALQEVISRWKNLPDEPLGGPLGALAASAFSGRDEVKALIQRSSRLVLTSVPSRTAALIRRAYNPAAVLARQVARRLRVHYEPHALSLVVEGEGAKGHGRRARLERVRGHMRGCARRLAGRDVIVLDDVITTGATIAEASRACLEAGAQSVVGLALARVPER